MKKWLKRLLIVVVVVGVVVGVAAGYFYYLAKYGRPDWWPQARMNAQALEEAGRRADQTVMRMANWVEETRAAERRGRRPGAVIEGGAPDEAGGAKANRHASGDPADGLTVTPPESGPREFTIMFTEDELNAFWAKWETMYDLKEKYGKRMKDPMVVLHDGNIILAAESQDLGNLVSLHFEAEITKDGKLEIEL